MKLLPFDSETTGIPNWKLPSESEEQPHIVQLAALLVDSETKEEIASLDVIVKPNGWIIPQETIDIHGITNEMAMDVGIPEEEALQMFIDLYLKADLRIAHNTTFDNRIIRIGLKRHFPNVIPDDEWKDKERYFCTLNKFKKLVGGKDGHTLGEAYKYFTNKEFEGAHNAMNDTRACLDVYYGLTK